MKKKPEKANVSLLNFSLEVVKDEQIRLPLILNDTTLREGEQSADVVFSVEEKIEFCSMLAAAGISQVQLHANRDASTIEKIRKKFPSLKVEALVTGIASNWKDQIKMAVEAGAETIHIVYRASELMLKYSLEQTYEEMLNKVTERIAYACDLKAPIVAFAPSDTTRTEIDQLIGVAKVAVAAGAHSVSLPDTVGVIRPRAYAWLVSQVRNAVSDEVLIGVHCHNDFGLALANTYAGMEAGAQIFDVSVNGLGERAGGVAVDEFVIGLWALYGIDIGVRLRELAKISEWAAKVTGIPIPVTKPIVGENAFLHKVDVHVAAARKAPFLFEPFDPEVIGKGRTLRYGVGSGIVTLEEKLRELGLAVSSDRIPELKGRLDHQVRVKKHSLLDEEIRAFAAEFTQKR